MIFVKLTLDNKDFIQELEIQGHAIKDKDISLECAVVSTIVELIRLAFLEIHRNHNIIIHTDIGYFKMNILEKNKEKKDFIEKFLSPFISMLYNLSLQYKKSIHFEFIKKGDSYGT